MNSWRNRQSSRRFLMPLSPDEIHSRHQKGSRIPTTGQSSALPITTLRTSRRHSPNWHGIAATLTISSFCRGLSWKSPSLWKGPQPGARFTSCVCLPRVQKPPIYASPLTRCAQRKRPTGTSDIQLRYPDCPTLFISYALIRHSRRCALARTCGQVKESRVNPKK